MFLRGDLDELLGHEGFPAVSIHLPTHPAGREVRQDPILLRSLLSSAADKLAPVGRPHDIERLLEPARQLLDDEAFWRHRGTGLAIFLATGFHRIHKLPIELPERLALGTHFAIRPLLPMAEKAGRYLILTITAGRTRVYQASRWSCDEMTGLDLPQGVEAIRGESVYEAAHNAAPTGRPQRGPSGLAKAQAFGEAPDELHKTQLVELLHRVAATVGPLIARNPVPLILAATPEFQGNFRALARWKMLLPEGIRENPDAMSPRELHQKSWRLMAPRQEQDRADALGHLESLLGGGDSRATTKPQEIVKAARYGRVDQLFLTDNAPLWGRFDETNDRIIAHGEAKEGDEDLMDYAALMTLRHGGNVILADRSQLPPDGAAAAILRY